MTKKQKLMILHSVGHGEHICKLKISNKIKTNENSIILRTQVTLIDQFHLDVVLTELKYHNSKQYQRWKC